MKAREYLDKLKDSYGFKTDLELSNELNVTTIAMAKWINRNKIPDRIYNLCSKDLLVPKNTLSIPKISTINTSYDNNESIGELILDKTIFKTPIPKTLFAIHINDYSIGNCFYSDTWVIFDNTINFVGDGLYVLSWGDCFMVKQIIATSKKNIVTVITINQDKLSQNINLTDTECSFKILGKVVKTIQ